ncbi:MAG TPA: LecA/PA-IL family lectin [Pyrinomonadaceae bacterium]|nr:LecA/PA-IL family lectin [Pyrinomonadaceae bacterium]
MFSRSNLLRSVIVVAVISLFASAGFADTIRLKTGSMIKGKITSFRGGRFTITIGEGSRMRTLTFGSEEVDSIEFDKPPQDTAIVYREPSPSVEPTPQPAPETVTEATQPPVSAAPPTVIGNEARNTRSTSSARPVELSVKVLADNTANGWTNTGWVVKRGQRIRISGTGEVSIGRGNSTTASGRYDLDDDQKLMKNVPTGALIAVIGDDNNDFLYIGAEREITATRDGILFLGVNEGNLNDNTGSFSVKIQISPEGAE